MQLKNSRARGSLLSNCKQVTYYAISVAQQAFFGVFRKFALFGEIARRRYRAPTAS